MGDRIACVPVEILRIRHVGSGWCDACALPSVVAAELLLLVGHASTRYGLLIVCTDCGRVAR